MKKIKKAKYMEEYRITKSKNEFIKLMNERYPEMAKSTITRRWYDCKKLEAGYKFKYKVEYEDTETRDEFIGIMMERYPLLKMSSIKRYYRMLRSYLGRQIPKPQKYYEHKHDEKQRPSHFKMLLINDMKRYGKQTTRGYLQKHGFNTLEINWLEEKGYVVE